MAPPVPPALTALLRMDGKGLSSRPPQRCVSVCHDFNVRLLGSLGEPRYTNSNTIVIDQS